MQFNLFVSKLILIIKYILFTLVIESLLKTILLNKYQINKAIIIMATNKSKLPQIKLNLAYYIRILFIVAFNTVFTSIFSQSQVLFTKLNQSKGLSNDRVSSIVKERNGFVWIGTENGLNRFDGNKIKIYNKQNSALSSNDISDLLIDRNGKIWIATLGGGLNIYNPSTDQFDIYKHIPNDDSSIPSNDLNTIFEDSKGVIWLGTKNGLCIFSPKDQSFKTYKHDQKINYSLSNNDIRSIYEDRQKNFWIGTFGGGLNKFNPQKETFYRIKSSTTIAAD
jgi:ligand-binding sensor domain-containing protein